jgi:hypothetical protein
VPSRNWTDASQASEDELERFLHVHALNRGVLITPFHNLALHRSLPATRRRSRPLRDYELCAIGLPDIEHRLGP